MFSQNVGCFGSGSTEADQYLARMTDTDPTLRSHITTLINGLVFDGIWPLLDKLTVAQTLESDSLLNLVSPSYPSVNVGPCAFVADQGFTTDFATTHYLRTGFTPTGSTKYATNDMSQFVYRRSGVEQGYMSGFVGHVGDVELLHDAGGGNISAVMQTISSVTVSHTAGFQGGSRIDASNVIACSKRSTTSAVFASFARSTLYELYIGTANITGALSASALDWSDGQYAAHGCGAGLSVIQLLALEARLQTYFTSRGSAV